MPILSVEMVLAIGESVPPELSRAIADAAAAVFQSPAGQTWIRVYELPRERYSENSGGNDPEIRPVFVRVLKFVVPPEPELESEISALAAAIARVCHRRVDEVHIVYDPPVAGRIAFGGKLFRGGGRQVDG